MASNFARRAASQEAIILALKAKINFILARPRMFTRNTEELRTLLLGYIDSLRIAHFGDTGFFLPVILRVEDSENEEEELVKTVKQLLVRIPDDAETVHFDATIKDLPEGS